MARCPFAVWKPISGSSGPHLGGPFKIVHHTTEGHSAESAMHQFRVNRSDPHFTVEGATIYQHIDTAEGARALRNDSGGVQTNRDSAVQIELVGFAHLPKDLTALTNVARLCRWIEDTHGVPRVWPSGPPKPAKNGKDPGGHNRNPGTWNMQGGHYGHCHVPENSHWDPAYSAQEADFVLAAEFGRDGTLVSPVPPASPVGATAGRSDASGRKGRAGGAAGKRTPASDAPQAVVSTMPDHAQIPRGVPAYIYDLSLSMQPAGLVRPRVAGRRTAAAVPALPVGASIDAGSLISFVAGLTPEEKDDVLYSVQLAQRGASGAYDRFTQTQAWYQTYLEVLENLGWAAQTLAFSQQTESKGKLQMNKAALQLIAAVAVGNQLQVLEQGLVALGNVADGDPCVELFNFHATSQGGGNFQLGAVHREENGALSMALGAFYFRAVDQRKRFLFVRWGYDKLNFWAAAQQLTLNRQLYGAVRTEVAKKLGLDAADYVRDLKLG